MTLSFCPISFYNEPETLYCRARIRLAWQISSSLEKLREIPSKLIPDDCSCLYSYYLQKDIKQALILEPCDVSTANSEMIDITTVNSFFIVKSFRYACL